MTPTEILLALRKRLWLIGSGALIAGAMALILSLVWPPVYSAEALLLITKLRSDVTLVPQFQTVAEENIVNLSVQDDQVRRQTLIGLAKSHDLLSQLMGRLGQTLAPDERSLSFLDGATDATTQGNLIILEAKADSPDKVAAIANAWAEAYRDRVNLLYSATSPAYEQIQEQVTEAHALYEHASQAVDQFERTNSERELARQIDQKTKILQDLEAAHVAAARQRVASMLARALEIDRLLLSAQNLQTQLADVPASATLSPGEQFALFTLEAGTFTQKPPFSMTLELGTSWLGDQSITAGQAVEKLDALQETLAMAGETLHADVTERSLALLEGTEILALGPDDVGTREIARLQSEINNLRADLQTVQRARQDLVDEKDRTRENYLALARKAAEIQILSQLTDVEVQIATTALEPENPSFPRPLMSTALALVAGALVGVALALFLEAKSSWMGS